MTADQHAGHYLPALTVAEQHDPRIALAFAAVDVLLDVLLALADAVLDTGEVLETWTRRVWKRATVPSSFANQGLSDILLASLVRVVRSVLLRLVGVAFGAAGGEDKDAGGAWCAVGVRAWAVLG